MDILRTTQPRTSQSRLAESGKGRRNVQASVPTVGDSAEVEVAMPATDEAAEQQLAPNYLIFVHNDDVTPFEYVLNILERVFLLTDEIAEHIAITAHTEGRAVVLVRPREEARRLIGVAHSRARMDGFPLSFSMEPER